MAKHFSRLNMKKELKLLKIENVILTFPNNEKID
mgnify:CR=1 FL=1